MAEGLANVIGKRVAMVDTERGSDFYCQAVASRAVHPEAFTFDALYSRSLTEVLAEAAPESSPSPEAGRFAIRSNGSTS